MPVEQAIAPLESTTGRWLQVAPDWALFLDVDGTLLNIAQTPDAVEVGDHLRTVLAEVAPLLQGALALISGRRIAELDRLFAPLVLPTAGLHGLEHRDAAGRVRRFGKAGVLDDLRGPLGDFAAAHPGVILEDKSRTLALHYRRAPQVETEARCLVERLICGREHDLRVVDGKMVLEIKPRLADKGTAVRMFLAEPPFIGRRPVFLGDDVTDEDAFAEVNRLGGHSVRVGEVASTQARFKLPDVEAVVAWLGTMALSLSTLSNEGS